MSKLLMKSKWVMNPKSDNWIEVTRQKFLTEHKKEIDGVNVFVSLSPYDVPLAFRGEPEGEDFVISFRYPTEEEPKRVEHDKRTDVEIGVNSGRIYAIRVKLPDTGTKAVRLEFDETIGRTYQRLSRERDRPNLGVTQKLIEGRRNQWIEDWNRKPTAELDWNRKPASELAED